MLKAKDTPNLAKRTHKAIAISDEWKKIARRIPPAAPNPNEIMNANLIPTAFNPSKHHALCNAY